MAGRPVWCAACRALINALSTNATPSSTASSMPYSLCDTRLMASGASMARSSASLPALLDASTQVSAMPGLQRLALQLQQFANALVGMVQQRVQLLATEGM